MYKNPHSYYENYFSQNKSKFLYYDYLSHPKWIKIKEISLNRMLSIHLYEKHGVWSDYAKKYQM